MVTYRDDREALLMRAEALERELAIARADNERLQREAEAEAEAEQPAPPPPPTTTTTALVPSPPAPVVPRPSRTQAIGAAGVVGAAWSALALAAGAATWMVPAAVASVLGAAWLAPRAGAWLAGRRLCARWPTLPIDAAAYRELTTHPRRRVVVQIDVTFARPPARTEHRALRDKLRTTGNISFDAATLTISSGTLRTRRDGIFDPTPIREFCARAFDRLAVLHATHPLTAVRPRAKAR